jgi:hypothetical protein
MKIRCSSLGKIMTNARKKGEVLSQTAKSYIRDIAKQDFYNYESQLDNKYLDKGNQCEQDSIDLYNAVFFTGHEKNSERITNDFLTGECDINGLETIIDIKTSWSLETFPALPDDAQDKMYEWQVRGYMMLYNKMNAEVAFCMVSTPNELLKDWDNHSIHSVDHIEPSHRITINKYERDFELDSQIEEKCIEAIRYYTEYINLLNQKNEH